jgi:hypothetical protein
MQYIKVRWIHDSAKDPVDLYSEIDENRWETRKVYVYRDGHMDFADDSEEVGDIFLGTEPVPSLAEIAEDPQFQPITIGEPEFEEVWHQAKEKRS